MSQDRIEYIARFCANCGVKKSGAAGKYQKEQVCKMEKSKKAVQTMAIALALICSMATVSASVTYQIGDGGLETVNISMPGVYVGNALAGGISITQVGVNDAPTYITVCTDIGATLYLGQSYSYDDPTSFNNLNQPGGINPKWGTGANGGVSGDGSWAKAIQNAAYIFNTFGNLVSGGSLALGGGLRSPTDQATMDLNTAIQLAVWDVLYNTDAKGEVTGSRFIFSGADNTVTTDVNTWISVLNGSYNISGSLLVPDPLLAGQALVNNNNEQPQELLIQAPPGIESKVVPVPEASTIIAGVLLLLPLGASTFRILNKRRAE